MKEDILHVPSAEGIEPRRIIEFHGRKALTAKIKMANLPAYIEDILINSLCDVLLPMGFVDKEQDLAYYDITDTLTLKEMEKYWKEDELWKKGNDGPGIGTPMTEALIRIIEVVYLVENYLFINNGFYLKWDNIFFAGGENRPGKEGQSGHGSKIKLAFEPDERENMALSTNLTPKILKLIEDSLNIIDDEEWNCYGAQLLKILEAKDSLLEVTRKLNHLGREISSRAWPDLSSLRQF